MQNSVVVINLKLWLLTYNSRPLCCVAYIWQYARA